MKPTERQEKARVCQGRGRLKEICSEVRANLGVGQHWAARESHLAFSVCSSFYTWQGIISKRSRQFLQRFTPDWFLKRGRRIQPVAQLQYSL